MEITIPKASLPGVLVDDLHLLDGSCGAVQNNTHFTLQTGFIECGTEFNTTAPTISYTNSVDFLRSAAHHDVITRVDDEFAVIFTCTYSREKELISSVVQPKKTKVRLNKHRNGEFKFSFKLFPSGRYDAPFTAFPVSLKLRHPIYFEVAVESADNLLSILAKNCYATPTRDGAKPVYQLIEHG